MTTTRMGKIAPNVTGVVMGLRTVPKERLWTKVWRTLLGIAIAIVSATVLPDSLVKWGWIIAGVLVTTEWVLAPLKLLGAAVVDLAPAVRELRKALKGSGGDHPPA